MSDTPYGFDTLAIHAGSRPDPATGARQTPIYQTTAYVFRDADHAAALFNLQEVGYIYSRLTNPTVSVLQERIATLEGGVGAVCCSSGHAAQIMALFPLMRPGDNVIASTRLYGGTYTQFTHTIRRFGWSAEFVEAGREIHPLAVVGGAQQFAVRRVGRGLRSGGSGARDENQQQVAAEQRIVVGH
jgi:O-acetylhomoserine (thiol)-lyase